jgi:hypothetical protein
MVNRPGTIQNYYFRSLLGQPRQAGLFSAHANKRQL